MPRRFLWYLLAAIIGFASGAGLGFSVYPINYPTHVERANGTPDEHANEHKIAKTWGQTFSLLWEKTWDDPVAFYTLVLSIFTGLLAIVAGSQIYFLIRTDKTARISAEAAKRSADALQTVEQAYVYPFVITAGAVSECIQSALVFYLGDVTKDDTPIPETTEITFRIKNYGKTPAILKTVYAGYGVWPIGALIGFAIPEATLGPMETTGDLICPMWIALTRRQAINIRDYQAYLNFEGTITFDDIWGNERTTKFVFSWDKEIQRMALRSVDTEIEEHTS